ncbi:unnamed protein product [Vitrella brassicaformis CCMP3155]|uniref:AP2/ERF domain-containing protein n=1 Tax=Vitrella brassicaformis (strain CCMP3155) TaxID=1169540 RepID=A0A0G4FSU7_VITBC|nr:unnamed protein product [Vitrella brassicaformis CCMP3155]|eukprot:CEM17379.1 unnamed protein product [Vitrella brassicaformis CCMP3155]
MKKSKASTKPKAASAQATMALSDKRGGRSLGAIPDLMLVGSQIIQDVCHMSTPLSDFKNHAGATPPTSLAPSPGTPSPPSTADPHRTDTMTPQQQMEYCTMLLEKTENLGYTQMHLYMTMKKALMDGGDTWKEAAAKIEAFRETKTPEVLKDVMREWSKARMVKAIREKLTADEIAKLIDGKDDKFKDDESSYATLATYFLSEGRDIFILEQQMAMQTAEKAAPVPELSSAAVPSASSRPSGAKSTTSSSSSSGGGGAKEGNGGGDGDVPMEDSSEVSSVGVDVKDVVARLLKTYIMMTTEDIWPLEVDAKDAMKFDQLYKKHALAELHFPEPHLRKFARSADGAEIKKAIDKRFRSEIGQMIELNFESHTYMKLLRGIMLVDRLFHDPPETYQPIPVDKMTHEQGRDVLVELMLAAGWTDENHDEDDMDMDLDEHVPSTKTTKRVSGDVQMSSRGGGEDSDSGESVGFFEWYAHCNPNDTGDVDDLTLAMEVLSAGEKKRKDTPRRGRANAKKKAARGRAPSRASVPAGHVPSSIYASNPEWAADTDRKTNTKGTVITKSEHQSDVTGVTWQEGNQAWVAKWSEKGDLKQKFKYFYVSDHGFDKAKTLAEEHRREMERTGRAVVKKRSEHQSGVKGVSYDKGSNSWIASWYEGGKRKFKPFSVRELGYEGAKQAAIAHRRAMEERHYTFKDKAVKED